MKVRALKTQIGDYGKKYPGDEFNVLSSYGKKLIDSGLAAEVIEPEEKEKQESVEAKEKKEVKHTSKNKK
jgi:hypothetical protein